MQCHEHWDYHPYLPYGYEKDWLITRLEPGAGSLTLEYTPAEKADFLWKQGDVLHRIPAENGRLCLQGLPSEGEISIALAASGQEPKVWHPVVMGERTGKVIHYLHPRDERYAFSGSYLCSPSMIRLPSGRLVASCDVFGHGTPQNLSLVYGSDDDGATWFTLAELFPLFWGQLFLVNGTLYMLGVSTEYGDLLVGASYDEGRHWTKPTVLLRGSTQTKVGGPHRAPMPFTVCGHNLLTSLEWGGWGLGGHGSCVLTLDTRLDPLVPEAWHITPPTWQDNAWLGAAPTGAMGMIEGNICLGPDGKPYNLLRYCLTSECIPNHDRAVMLAYEGPDAPQRFCRILDFPGGITKFYTRFDPVSGRHICLFNRVTNPDTPVMRNVLSLSSSQDLIHWTVHADLLDWRDTDPQKVACQYPTFFIEGDEILAAVRVAALGADTFHDANTLCFYRFAFRSLLSNTLSELL